MSDSQAQSVLLESWVMKSELDNHNELFASGRGFKIGNDSPKMFTVG